MKSGQDFSPLCEIRTGPDATQHVDPLQAVQAAQAQHTLPCVRVPIPDKAMAHSINKMIATKQTHGN